jgi:curved DNA-binding protein CbpA
VTAPDPFTALGLPRAPGLSDEQVRAAWRNIAAATHPDRADGGDPARYAAASGAYAALRTSWGRSEAYADYASAPVLAALSRHYGESRELPARRRSFL